ncbi:MAG: hypothetical protein GY869_21625, partial [Planctomycetes bacterium]|nr:hypothetical protein [Planctomycetota bacterium]
MSLRKNAILISSVVVLILLSWSAFIVGQDNVFITRSDEGSRETRTDGPHGDFDTYGFNCESCHELHMGFPALTFIGGNASLCMSCHISGGSADALPFTVAYSSVPGDSGISHAWEVPAVNASHGAQLPTNPDLAARIIEGEIICSTCHDQHSQDFPPYLRASNAQDALCKDCHAVRDVGSWYANPANMGSHPVGTGYPPAGSDTRFYDSPQSLALNDGRVECSVCHSIHYADSGGARGGLGDGNILRMTNDQVLCEDCHTYSDHQGMNCLVCHLAHDPSPTNILLVRETIDTPNSGPQSVIFS